MSENEKCNRLIRKMIKIILIIILGILGIYYVSIAYCMHKSMSASRFDKVLNWPLSKQVRALDGKINNVTIRLSEDPYLLECVTIEITYKDKALKKETLTTLYENLIKVTAEKMYINVYLEYFKNPIIIIGIKFNDKNEVRFYSTFDENSSQASGEEFIPFNNWYHGKELLQDGPVVNKRN